MRSEYNTRQKSAVLACLAERRGEHVSAAEIAEHLNENGTPVSVSTVYRTLERLSAAGAVRKFVIDEQTGACYQYADDEKCAQHFHLKCTDCGKLIHAECEFLEELDAHILSHHGFFVASGKTVLYGLCAECLAKREENGQKEPGNGENAAANDNFSHEI